MGTFREAEDEDDLAKKLQERACPQCRRLLQPWETVCPNDGTASIPRTELAALDDELVAGLGLDPALFADLDDTAVADADREPDDADPDDDALADTGLDDATPPPTQAPAPTQAPTPPPTPAPARLPATGPAEVHWPPGDQQISWSTDSQGHP